MCAGKIREHDGFSLHNGKSVLTYQVESLGSLPSPLTGSGGAPKTIVRLAPGEGAWVSSPGCYVMFTVLGDDGYSQQCVGYGGPAGNRVRVAPAPCAQTVYAYCLAVSQVEVDPLLGLVTVLPQQTTRCRLVAERRDSDFPVWSMTLTVLPTGSTANITGVTAGATLTLGMAFYLARWFAFGGNTGLQARTVDGIIGSTTGYYPITPPSIYRPLSGRDVIQALNTGGSDAGCQVSFSSYPLS